MTAVTFSRLVDAWLENPGEDRVLEAQRLSLGLMSIEYPCQVPRAIRAKSVALCALLSNFFCRDSIGPRREAESMEQDDRSTERQDPESYVSREWEQYDHIGSSMPDMARTTWNFHSAVPF